MVRFSGFFVAVQTHRGVGHGNDHQYNKTFVNAFVTASLTICVGAMAIVGSIQDGIYGDWSLLAVKSVLDMIIIVMTATLGKGAAFSAFPVGTFAG